MNWISVDDALPDGGFDCFVIYPNGYGYGNYNDEYDWDRFGKLLNTGKKKWYLDFDAVGYEDEITHWMKIEYPDHESYNSIIE